MATFGLKTENNLDVNNYLEKVNANIENSFFFKGSITPVEIKEPDKFRYYLVDISPLTPPFYYVGLILLIVTFLFKGWELSYWYIVPILISATYFLWSDFFLITVIRLGLKKLRVYLPIGFISAKKFLKILKKVG